MFFYYVSSVLYNCLEELLLLVVVQLSSHVWLFMTPWTAVCQVSLSLTISSVLAWRIPGMGEPGGLPSMGSHRVGHDWSDLAAAAPSPGICPNSCPLNPWCQPTISSSVSHCLQKVNLSQDILNYRVLGVSEIEIVFYITLCLHSPTWNYCGDLFLEIITISEWVLYVIIEHPWGTCYSYTLAIALLSPEVPWSCDVLLAIDFLYLSFILLLDNLSLLQWGLCCPSKCQRISTRQLLIWVS